MPFTRLNYRHLYYFWMVAKEGHLTRVAEQMHVSQSALSAQIKQLETQMGHDLFVREGRTLKLTEWGRMVLSYADNIFALGGELIAMVVEGQGRKLQRLRVGGVTNLSRNFQENFLRPVMGMDDAQLILESGTLEGLINRLGLHKLDLVLSNRPIATDAKQVMRCRRIARQPVCLIGPPLPKNKTFRFPEDLQNVKLLLPGQSSDIRTEFDMVCASLSIAPHIFAEVDDMAMLRLLARDSGCVALVPAVVVQDELHAGSLQQYCVVPKVYENFYAISAVRHFQHEVLNKLLSENT